MPVLRIYRQDSDQYKPFTPRPYLEDEMDAKPRAQNRRQTRYEIEAIYVKPRIDSVVSRVDQGMICRPLEVMSGVWIKGWHKTDARRLWAELETKLERMNSGQ